MTEEDDMTAAQAELAQVQNELTTAKALLTETIRLMTKTQVSSSMDLLIECMLLLDRDFSVVSKAQGQAELAAVKALLVECIKLLTDEQVHRLRVKAGVIDLEWLGRQ